MYFKRETIYSCCEVQHLNGSRALLFKKLRKTATLKLEFTVYQVLNDQTLKTGVMPVKMETF